MFRLRWVGRGWRALTRVVVCVLLAVSGLAAPWVSAAASEPANSQPGRDVAAERAPAAPGVGWWDGTAVLAASAPAVADQGVCAALEGWSLALLDSGSVAKACDGGAGSLSGSPTGAAWAVGADEGGRFAEVMLVGSAALGVDGYRALGELDVVFDGGAFAVDFAACEHSAAAGWSGCRVVVRDVSLPPGGFVGVGTVGIDKPASASRPRRDAPATPAAQRAALVALYDATDGPNWFRSTNWDTAAPVADWYGVTADTDGNITRLYLDFNGLSGSVPAEIGSLTYLDELYLSDNQLTAVPAEIGSLTYLDELWLDNNQLTAVPAEIGSLTYLTELYLSGNQLTAVPAEIGSLTNLWWLYLSGNQLTAVPAEIGSLTNLRWLSFSGNQLTAVPAEIGSLTNLSWLSFSGNQLTAVPAEIGSLTNLWWLYLSGNQLTAVPAEIGSLTNLISLRLDNNQLTAVPAEIGSLTNLTTLWLDNNQLTAVPAEIGSLTNLTTLWLDNNQLTAVPAEIGSLTNLTSLWLHDNHLTGCVPAALLTVLFIRLDPGVSFCELARLSVSDAAVSEGDSAAVFVVSVEPGTEPVAAPISLRWATVSGTAAPGSDYQGLSGTLSVPADRSRATITVPITDDSTAEDDESFSIRLSQPSGATLVDTWAVATIVDDDGSVLGLSPIAPCEGVVLSGSVSDVFDIAQPGHAGDFHVFVDVEVTCGTPGEAVGMPIGVEVASGPASSLGASSHCITVVGAQTVTRSTGAGQGCLAHAVTRPITGDTAGRSTHIVRVPDASVGQVHQLLVWVDADRDGAFDRGEPYLDFESDFKTQVPSEDGAESVFGVPRRFEVTLATPWSDRVSRAGQYTSLRLAVRTRTSEVIGHTFGGPVYRRVAIANTPVGVSMLAGPSRTAQVMCSVPPTDVVPSPGYSDRCATDARGYVDVRFRVPPDAVSVLRQQTDVLRVWLDTDHDGNYDFETVDEHQRIVTPEPASTLRVPLAKAVNYVALGDSYSSGEQGRPELAGFVGSYENDPDSADPQCRRWDRAYPYIFKNDALDDAQLGIEVTFATFACTGAESVHVYEPLDPDDDSTNPDVIDSRRPSPKAPAVGETGWEPRQLVSLAETGAASGVDMVTITVGGNDAGFGDALKRCVSPVTLDGIVPSIDLSANCAQGELPSVAEFAAVGDSVESVLRQVKSVASGASIFVLGYPYLTPCPPGVNGCAEPASRAEFDDCGALSAKDILAHTFDFDQDYSFLTIPLVPIIFVADFATDVTSMTGSAVLGDSARISLHEAQRLWLAADRLNDEVMDAASAAGVHFVPVAEESIGHSGCEDEDRAWVHGFVLDTSKTPAVSDRSFHPTKLGHREVARILEQYIARWIRSGRGVSEAGVPVNPGDEEVN